MILRRLEVVGEDVLFASNINANNLYVSVAKL